jgi:PAS domain S-box-containing protein
MFGYSVNDVVGRNVAMLMPLPDHNEQNNYLAHDLASGEKRFIGNGRELQGQRRDGTTFPLHLSVSELSGDQKLFTGIVHDLTTLKEAQERGLQNERLAAIGEMSTGLAHESRNALQRSQACLEMLRMETKTQPRALELIASIQRAQDDLLRLYEEVREYAAPLKLQRRASDLGQVLRDTWRHLLAERAGRAVEYRVAEDTHDLTCHVDPTRLEQVFRNILENSLDICPDPVVIEAAWSEIDADGRPMLRLALRNNGPPMSPQEAARVFDAFYTTKTHGTGLGLTIARRIVESHGGRIEVRSGLERGVEILVTLPRGTS